MSKAYQELMQIEQQKRDRLRQARQELEAKAAALATARRRYSEEEAEGSAGAEAALENVKKLEAEIEDAKRKLEVIEEAQEIIGRRQQELAAEFLKEAQAINEAAEEDKAAIWEELITVRSAFMAVIEQYLTAQAKQVELKKQLDRVFGNYPGGCHYGQDVFHKRPKLDIKPVYALPLVESEDLYKTLGSELLTTSY